MGREREDVDQFVLAVISSKTKAEKMVDSNTFVYNLTYNSSLKCAIFCVYNVLISMFN